MTFFDEKRKIIKNMKKNDKFFYSKKMVNNYFYSKKMVDNYFIFFCLLCLILTYFYFQVIRYVCRIL
jgi:phosphate starvation-inducible membrane PsiE